MSGAVSLAKLVPADARITAIPIACSRETVTVALGNAGDKAGVAESITLQGSKPVVLSPREGDAKPLIGGRQSSVIAYAYRERRTPAPLPQPSGDKCKYRLTLNTIDFAGKKLASDFECDCSSG